ncbi:hypothetical protein [Amycolatopsis sp. NPDC004169]|uniref:hypothetical protein n=1 Tax=Amycolatopsis sp. NPDC004169 TaxID=3154453 RepID=UPI00339E50B5
MLTHTDLGVAQLAAGEARSSYVPLGAVLPVRSDVLVHVPVLPLSGLDPRVLGRAGGAYIEGAPVSAGQWLVRSYLLPALNELFRQENAIR